MKSLQENLAQLRWMSEFQPNTNGTRAPQGKWYIYIYILDERRNNMSEVLCKRERESGGCLRMGGWVQTISLLNVNCQVHLIHFLLSMYMTIQCHINNKAYTQFLWRGYIACPQPCTDHRLAEANIAWEMFPIYPDSSKTPRIKIDASVTWEAYFDDPSSPYNQNVVQDYSKKASSSSCDPEVIGDELYLELQSDARKGILPFKFDRQHRPMVSLGKSSRNTSGQCTVI